MATKTRVQIRLELTHPDVSYSGDGTTVTAHKVSHEVFALMHRYGWSDDNVDSIVTLNDVPMRLRSIESRTLVFERLSALEALAACV